MPAPAAQARTRAKLLARRGQAAPPLVCPLVLAQAAEIEALPLQRFLTDATKLSGGLQALHDAFGNDVIVTAAGDDLAAAAAGAEPATDHPRVAAAVEATRRLAATTDAAVAAALCGPARLAAQLGLVPADAAVLERCGALLLTLAKAFLDAGANLLLLVEDETLPAGSGDGWRSAAAPLVNVARFHQAAPVVVLADPADAVVAPRGSVVCLPPAAATGGQGVALSPDPGAWQAPGAGAPLVTTLGPVHGRFAEVRAAVGRLTAAVAEV